MLIISQAHFHVQREVCPSKIPIDACERGVWLVVLSLLKDTNAVQPSGFWTAYDVACAA